MDLCNDGHDEVAYDSRKCPACVVLEALSAAEAEVKELEAQIGTLEDQLNEERNA